MPQKKSEWEDELKFEIMEEYISEARNFHATVDKKEGMKRIREHFEKLKTFIDQKIATAVSNRKKEIAEEVEKLKKSEELDITLGERAFSESQYAKAFNLAINAVLSILNTNNKRSTHDL